MKPKITMVYRNGWKILTERDAKTNRIDRVVFVRIKPKNSSWKELGLEAIG
ncbi:MAG: hypothetical protein JSW08_03085 [archaeon]|nr:MAG: hypothetical protein JSW08_03085 [archaeon]